MKNIHFEDETIIPENNFTAPQGKKFKGWSFTNNGEIITKLKVNESQTLYAIWEDEITNPKTLDNINMYIMIGFISTLGLTITQKKLKNIN